MPALRSSSLALEVPIEGMGKVIGPDAPGCPHRPLRVLLLEDSPDDAALLIGELEAAGYAVRAEVVDTREAFVARLGGGLGGGLDVILSDHALPQFNALQALDLVRRAGLDVPFVIVSGVIEEETAVEAMRRGASDYLLKDRLARLGQAVEQALEARRLRAEQARAHEATRESEARYRLLAEHATDVICRIAPDGSLLYASPSTRTLLGYEPEELTGRDAFALVHPGDVAELRQGLTSIRDQPYRPRVTFKARRKDGATVWIETNSRLVFDEASGDIREIVTVLRDVTERQQANEALRASERRLQALFDHSLDLIFLTGDGGRIVAANPAASALLGYTREELLDRTLWDLRPDIDPEEAQGHWDRLLSAGRTGGEHPVARKDGGVRQIEFRFAAHILPGLHLSILRDVTERKRFELELVKAKEAAEASDRLKGAILSNLSHEIRTPLTAILGHAELLGGASPEEVAESAAFIMRGAQRLLGTLSALLDLAQVEANQREVHVDVIDLREPVRRAVERYAPIAEVRGLTLTLTCAETPVAVEGDDDALEQVAAALVENALKFTHEGGATVTVRSAGAWGEFAVEDTGIGIGEAFLPYLFDAFEQESDGDARLFEGNGLGLALASRLVDKMGGTVTVESEKGAGTTFTIRFPLCVGVSPDGGSSPRLPSHPPPVGEHPVGNSASLS